jgi:hypothetical protein
VTCRISQRHTHVSFQHRHVVRAHLSAAPLSACQAIRIRKPNRQDVRQVLGLHLGEVQIRSQ